MVSCVLGFANINICAVKLKEGGHPAPRGWGATPYSSGVPWSSRYTTGRESANTAKDILLFLVRSYGTQLTPLSALDPSLTSTQFCAFLKTVLFCRVYETLA